MSLKDREDSRPVDFGDLIAAQWFDDPEYKIGKVGDYGENTITMDAVYNAHHVVKLMDAGEYGRMIENMGQQAFNPVTQQFTMVTTGDFDPLATVALHAALEVAAVQWLNWNYPK